MCAAPGGLGTSTVTAANEPVTIGRVIVVTNYGEIDIELWSKEAPLACRNFVQLCLEGYFNQTNFHRIVKGFAVQGGDPTGTGKGGESIFGKTFSDEFHSRLRFTRRGLVAMANAGKNDNGSQFFITLDRCEWLNNRHTIFGRVAGNTIFNVVRMGEVDTDEQDRPLYPVTIEKTEVLWNPFDDIRPRTLNSRISSNSASEQTAAEAVKKGVRNTALLSFGDDEEEDMQVESHIQKKRKIKSSHDTAENPRLLPSTSDEVGSDNVALLREKLREEAQKGLRSSAPPEVITGKQTDPNDFAAIMRQQILERQRRLATLDESEENTDEDSSGDEDGTGSHGDEDAQMDFSLEKAGPNMRGRATRKHESSSEDEKPPSHDIAYAGDKLHFKKGHRQHADPGKKEALSYLEEQRAKYLKKKKVYQARERFTLDNLLEFQNKLRKGSRPLNEMSPEKKMDDSSNDWMFHRLKFDKLLSDRTDEPSVDHYVVLDSRESSSSSLGVSKEKSKGEKDFSSFRHASPSKRWKHENFDEQLSHSRSPSPPPRKRRDHETERSRHRDANRSSKRSHDRRSHRH